MVVNEESTGWLDLTFFDKEGNQVTPDNLTYRIDCGANVILAETALTPAQNVSIEITPDQNQILEEFANERYQENVVTVVATLGSNKQATDEFKYKVKNLGYIL